MPIVLIHANIYTGKQVIEDGYVRFDQKILGVDTSARYEYQPGDRVIDVSDHIVVPGFIDVHTHGGYGADSMNPDPQIISGIVDQMAHEGVTGVFLTTMTQSAAAIANSMQTIKIAAEENPRILGIHLEGPFISPKYHGAQPTELIQKLDPDKIAKWNVLSGGLVKILTYAPEMGVDPRAVGYCREHDIQMAVGHSDSTYQLLRQVRSPHVTHLFNAQRGFHHREIGVVGYAMLSQAKVELICDGFHVVPEAVKIAYRMIGPNRLELVTDSMEAKGQPDGMYQLGGQPVSVARGRATLANGHLAGSVLKYADAFKNVIQFTGCSIASAVKMTSTNQAAEFHLRGKGFIEDGYDADLNLFDNHLDLMATYSYGKLVNKN